MFNIISHQEITNQNDSGILPYTCLNGLDQKLQLQLMLEMIWSKGKTPSLLMKVQTTFFPLWKLIWLFLRKLGTDYPQDKAITLLDIYTVCSNIPKGCLPRYVCIDFIHNSQNWKPSRCPSTQEWIKNMYERIHSHKYYPAAKNKTIIKCRQMDRTKE